MSKLTCTNSPKSSSVRYCVISLKIYCGGYSSEDPPLPIPNREVKLANADGTAIPSGRVGSCRFFSKRPESSDPGLLFAINSCLKFDLFSQIFVYLGFSNFSFFHKILVLPIFVKIFLVR